MRLGLVALTVLGLSACSTLPAPEAVPPAWTAQRARLQALTHWQLQGRVAARDDDHGWSGQFSWQQSGARYRLSLQGPLHQQGALLEGSPAGVQARLANGAQLTAPDAESLLHRELGVSLPVAHLQAWVLGIPSATVAPDEQYFNADGQLQTLVQGGWRIEYQRYQTVGAYTLPARLELSAHDIQAKILLDQWELP